MKVSDAIEQLIEFLDNFGDVEVEFSAEAGGPVHAQPETPDKLTAEEISWINSFHSRN